MANFKDKMQGKKYIGSDIINSDEAMGLVFKDSNKKVSLIKISALKENPYQPRITMDKNELKELADSIIENGLLQPIIISSINNSPKEFYIVAGHRRVEAHKMLHKEEIEAIIYKADDGQLKIFSILENMQRENLNPFEESKAINILLKSGISQVELAKKLGKSKGYISKIIKVAQLDLNAEKYILEQNLDVGLSILYELSRADAEHQLLIIKHFHKKSLTRDALVSFIQDFEKKENKSQKSFPGKQSNFLFKNKADKYSIKLNINKLNDNERNQAIKSLETLLNQLKYQKSFPGKQI